MNLKLGSLFDGSGGFPLAGLLCGVEPVWAAEVEPYPVAVTCSRFPNMKHYGDVSKVCGANVEPVDIVTFGSPCQDLSVAGKRAGLKHEENGDDETTRSGLFMEAVRIIKEMREATNGEYPTFAVWENVPGAFSSNKGEDFRTVLEEIIKITEPTAVVPPVPKSGWAYADCYCGDGWSLAYRVLDAQYWGVPQRRRRIYLVLDLTGQRAGSVLFERQGLRGHFAESRAAWEGTAGDAEDCTGAADRKGAVIAFAQNQRDEVRDLKGVAGALAAEPGMKQQTFLAIPTHDKATRYQGGGPTRNGDGAGNGFGVGKPGDPVPTLSTCDRHMVAYAIENHPADSRVNIDESGKVQTLTSRMGTGGGNVPMVLEQKAECLDLGFFNSYEEQSPTLLARGYKDPHLVAYPSDAVRYIVRRLTPTECARLQGFPDFWGHPDKKDDFDDREYKFWLDVRNTHAIINGKIEKEYTKSQMLTWYNKLHTDSSEYKMWGNGIALPCALYVMEGIAGTSVMQE